MSIPKPVYESFAIYSENTGKGLHPQLDTEEMPKDKMPDRIFNQKEAHHGHAITVSEDGKRINLKNGFYRINGVSFLTMLTAGVPPVPPVPLNNLNDIYPGYCILYKSNQPPTLQNMEGVICVGTMGTAYDSGPSIFECVLHVEDRSLDISLGHQCSYENHTDNDGKAFLRIGGSDYHVSARIAIFKIG